MESSRPMEKPKTQEELVSFWTSRIKRAQEARMSSERDWAENREMCNMGGYDNRDTSYQRVYKNIFLSTLNIMVPNLYNKNPSFTALPERDIDRRTYKASEMFVNYATSVTGLKAAAKDAIRDGLMATCGYLKVGYIIEPVKVKVQVHDDGTIEAIDESKPQPLSTLKTEERLGGVGTRPFTSRVSPFNLVRSRGSTSIKNAAWVAERIYVRVEEAKADPFLKNTGDLKPNALPFSADGFHGGSETVGIRSGQSADMQGIIEGQALSDPDEELVELWEIWDRINDKVMVLAIGHPKLLRDGPWPYNLQGRFPYVELQFIKISDIPYPIPYLTMFKDLVKEMNIIASYELEHVKRATPRVGYNEKLVDEEDVEAYQKGEPIPLVKCKGDPREAFTNIGGSELNPSLQWTHLKVEDDINLMSSMPDFMRGGAGAAGQLATVAKLKADASNVRLEEMVDVVSDWMIEWAELIHMLGKQFCDQQMQVRITGSATMKMATIGQRDIDNRCEFKLIAGSFQPINRDVQREEVMKLFNLIASFIDPSTLQVNGKALLMKIADLWPLPGMDKIVGDEAPPPPADPAEENWLFQNDGNPVVSPKEDFDKHIMVHTMFLQELQQDPDANMQIIAKVEEHLQDTVEAKQIAMIEEQVRMQAMQQAAMATSGMAEAQPGQPARGRGAGGPANNGPIRPRQFNTKAPTQAGIQGQAGRPGPGGA